MKNIIFPLIMFLCTHVLCAQSNIVTELQKEVPGQGKVNIYQPTELQSLMGTIAATSGKPLQTEGYRVQVYSGNNSRAAREEANRIAAYLRQNFPGAEVYVVFESPTRSCQYGDFRTREEAEAVMYKLKATKLFKEISVKKGIINLSY